jgi:hypothetical protein
MTENYHNSPSSYHLGGRSVRIHWRVFFIVNCFLLAMNVLTGFYYLWFLWPLMSWGIGLAIHASVIAINNRYPNNNQRGILIHFACFLILSVYLLFVNIITGIWYFDPWFLWPVAGMAIGIGEHFVAYKYIRGRETNRPTSRFHTLWYPGVVCLFLAFVNIMTGFWSPWFLWPSIPIMLTTFLIVGTITQTRAGEITSRPINSRSLLDESVAPDDTTPSDRSTNRRFCPKCGAPVVPTHPFCEYCGMKLS